MPPHFPNSPNSSNLSKSPRSPIDWIALNLLPGLGPTNLHRALLRFGDPAAIAYRLPLSAFAELPRFSRKRFDEIAIARKGLRRRAEREWRRCERRGIRVLTLADEGYPAALREIHDPPIVLYVQGNLEPAVVRVAVIGSRNPTAYGKRVATGLGMGLAARGIEVVSGGARGVDTCAHGGALQEEDGRTVAVLGSGLLRPYPPENVDRFREIVAQGALVSEFPLETEPQTWHFPRRNRLISGLSAAVVVVEAAARSGSLSTAGHALEQGREVLAVPGPVSSTRSVGCHKLIQQGAKLVQNIGDILEELPPPYHGALAAEPTLGHLEEQPQLEGLAPDERILLEMLDEIEPVQLDDLADRVPYGVARLQAALFGLELRGTVEQTPGRYYLLRPRKEP